MVNLIERSPSAGLLPVSWGDTALTEYCPVAITSIAPFSGQEKSVSTALKSAFGATLPAPNRTTGKEGARCIWFGRGQAIFVGEKIEKIEGAAVTDQSDAWVILRLSGKSAEAVLARLVPVDLGENSFKRGWTVRTLVNHMSSSITRTGANSFDIMVFRSMAASAVHELENAMRSVSAQS